MMKIRHLLWAGVIAGICIAAPMFIVLIFKEIITDMGDVINCTLWSWIAIGGAFSAWLYRRFSKTLTVKIGLLVGEISGFTGLIFSLLPMTTLLTFLTIGSGQNITQGITDVYPDLSKWELIVLIYTGFIMAISLNWIVFGLVGGLIGTLVFQGKKSQLITSP